VNEALRSRVRPSVLPYQAKDGRTHMLNLVDTPGHVDFSYEVSRAISACEGAILVIDATQGVEAQTLSNMYLALEHDLEIIPVINKIDMPAANVEEIRRQIDKDLGLDGDAALAVSAKLGTGVDALFEAIVERIPPPNGRSENPLQALIFDSHYDPYERGGDSPETEGRLVAEGDAYSSFVHRGYPRSGGGRPLSNRRGAR